MLVEMAWHTFSPSMCTSAHVAPFANITQMNVMNDTPKRATANTYITPQATTGGHQNQGGHQILQHSDACHTETCLGAQDALVDAMNLL